MSHGPPPSVTTRSVQMNLMRASPPVLLLATAMAIVALCQLINRADAGGKGKVPVYIPIPIPMPMGGGGGPPPQHGKPPGYHNHNQQHEGEGEVRKIYLLQPMAPARPQPHLKGGGFMGVPVQNNIHLGPGMAHHQLSMMSPGKHRHGGKTSLTFDSFGEQHQHQQVPIQQVQEEPAHRHVKSAASEVKILPIVVIPPMAPMPPVQVPTAGHQLQAASHAPRMTLTPQFNNYVLAAGAGSHDRRRTSSGGAQPHGGGHRRATTESFSEYGGSLGGSVFRERFAGASKLRPNRGRTFRIVAESEITPAAGQRARMPADFDYGDYEQQGSSDLRTLEELMQQQRRASNRRRRGDDFPSHRAQQQHHRIKSIRDIIEQSEQEEAAAAASGSGFDDLDVQRHLSVTPRDLADGSEPVSLSLRAGGGIRGSRASLGGANTMEISLDELGLSATSGLDHRAGASTQQDLGASLYYDRLSDSPASESYRGRLRGAPSSLSGGGGHRLPRADERDLFDDSETDEWRSDTRQSVRHAAPNATTVATGSARPIKGATSLTSLGSTHTNQTELAPPPSHLN